MMRVAFVSLLVLLTASAATSQTDGSGYLTVACPERGLLLIDDIPQRPCGPSTLSADGTVSEAESVYTVFLGERRLTLIDEATGWNPRRVEATVDVDGSATTELRLPVRTRVETLPLGADIAVVYASGEREHIGPGPATIDLPRGTTARVIATLDGHLDAGADLPSAETVALILRPVGQPDADPVTLLPMRGSTRTRTLIDLGIGAATAVAGAVAIHYKFRADDLDDQYRDDTSLRRGDATLLSQINRNDTYSNVALAGMQVGLGVLAVRFILR